MANSISFLVIELKAIFFGKNWRISPWVAVPLIDRRGDLVGAPNVTMPMGHESTEDAVQRVLPVLLETARALRNLI